MTNGQLILTLVAAHALCDYPLQGDFLARAKNHTAPIPGVPWYQALMAHSLIQAAAVVIITGSWALGILEYFAHLFIDFAKSQNGLTYNQDQFLHVVCKVAWVVLLPFLPD